MSAYLIGNASLLREIDTATRALTNRAREVGRYSGKATAWLTHFAHAWRSICRDIGWPEPDDLGPVSWKTAIRRWRRRPIPPSGMPHPWGPPVLRDEGIALTWPPDRATYRTAYGFTMRSHGLDMWQPLASGHYTGEAAETFAFLRLLPRLECFIDVGANIGFFSLLAAAQASSDLRILAFEPAPLTFASFAESISANGFAQRIDASQIAVGAEEGEGTLFVNDGGAGSHTLDRQSTFRYDKKTETIKIRTLDKLIEDASIAGRRTLVKIDVEGTEFQVLRGAETWLRSTVPPILLYEAWPGARPFGTKSPAALGKHLAARGFHLFTMRRAQQGEPLIREWNPSHGLAPIGNYLAIPPWAAEHIAVLRQPVDLRLLTEPEALRRIHYFVTGSAAALEKHLRENLIEETA